MGFERGFLGGRGCDFHKVGVCGVMGHGRYRAGDWTEERVKVGGFLSLSLSLSLAVDLASLGIVS